MQPAPHHQDRAEPAAGGAAASSMDQSLARNVAWRAVASWSSQIISWAAFLLVVRLLTPSDFGIVAMAMVLFAYLRIVGEFGIQAAVVNLRDLRDSELAQLNTVAAGLGFASFGLACVLAHPVAVFFKSPHVAAVVVVSSATVVTLGFRSVPEGLLEREMRIGLLSTFNAGRVVLAALVTLLMAWLGFGYWALVYGNLIGFAARTVAVLVVRPLRFAWPRLAALREPLRLGWHVLVSTVAWSAYSTLDNVTAGKVLGQAALGFYGMAWNLANTPLEKVTTLVSTVVPTYLAAVQHDSAALRRYVRTLSESMALAAFPAAIGLALVARELVPFALGRKWEPAIPVLEVLGFYAAFRSVVALLGKVLVATGRARFVMGIQLWALAVMPCAFYIGSHWGITGIAWGWVAGYPLAAIPLYRKTFQTIGMSVGEYLTALRPALEGSAAMTAAVFLVKWGVPAGPAMLVRLCAEIAAGAGAYTGAVLLLHRKRALAYYQMARRLRRRPGAAVSAAAAAIPASPQD